MTPNRVYTPADLKSEFIPFGDGEPGGMHYDGFDDCGLDADLIEEIRKALRDGGETQVEVYKGSPTYAYFPTLGRGCVDDGGGTSHNWSDADSLDDLAERWAEYQARGAAEMDESAEYDPADWSAYWSN